MFDELSIFDYMYPKYKPKKIRLIELFAGYGSQNLALKYLGADYEHWKICEWAVKSIQAYNDIHIGDYSDYSKDLSQEEVIEYLHEKGISMNYNEPMTLDQIKRKGEAWQRQTYNNIIATNNLVNIQQAKGKDLEIVDTDKYTYLLCYSFPCQDLSLAGLGKGMADTSTRSGMLWEVERILDECNELGTLPQVLLMENVTQVVGTKNIKHFQKWRKKLEELGYQNYTQNLIATDYGIPQTRDRTFMVSILGNYNYNSLQKMELKIKLKDLLEEKVDKKYYLSNKSIQGRIETNYQKYKLEENLINNKDVHPTILARYEGVPTLYVDKPTLLGGIGEMKSNNGTQFHQQDRIYKSDIAVCLVAKNNPYYVEGLMLPEKTKKGYAIAEEGDGVYISRPHKKRGVVQKNKIQTLRCNANNLGVCVREEMDQETSFLGTYNYGKSDNFMQNKPRLKEGKNVADTLLSTNKEGVAYSDLRIRRLTPKECFRLMGVKEEDFLSVKRNQSDSSLYHLAGDSIVTTVLMGIFGELLGIDYCTKINQLVESLVCGK